MTSSDTPQAGPNFRLDGQVCLVTGSSRGIGAAAARALAAQGASVALACLDDPRMIAHTEQLAADLRAVGSRVVVLPCDVTDAGMVRKMVQRSEDELGPLNTLIANAATIAPCEWRDLDEAEWDRVMSVNARGTFSSVRAALDLMATRGRGSIITVSSVTVRRGYGGSVAYIASKGAVVALTRALARVAGASGVRVNSVMPGAILTETVVEESPDSVMYDLSDEQCLRRQGRARDLAGVFVYLASSASDFVTGQVIAVDGGLIHY